MMDFDFSWFSVAWLGWGVYFFAVEAIAIWGKYPNATLSAHLWRGIYLHPYLIGLPLLGLLMWAAHHLFTQSTWEGQ
jgi:hypothetical protein